MGGDGLTKFVSSKQKAVKLTPDVISAVEHAREALPGRLNFSDVLRQAVDMWLGNAPQALDAEELWALKSLRALGRERPDMRAEFLRTLAGAAAQVGVQWPNDVSEKRDASTNANGEVTRIAS